MITLQRLSYTYPSGQSALRGVSLEIPDSAFVLVTGVSGAGKSTLLRALNGLVPHFYGGKIGGSVTVDGHSTLETPPRQLAHSVGFVFQDPETQFVVQTVEDEIAFGLENQGVPPGEMRRRIDETLALLGIAHLRQRSVNTLSGGEAQRVAVASALALRPRHLVLDEPTSQLDPIGAHELLDTLVELNRRHRLTIILAEHRLERVLQHATHLLHLDSDGLRFGPVRSVLPEAPLRPPVVEAALRLGWSPLPLSVEAARPFAAATRELHTNGHALQAAQWFPPVDDLAVEVCNLRVGYDGKPVIDSLNWSIARSEIVGLLGVNGAGKSTLLKTLVGLLLPEAGQVRLLGVDVYTQSKQRGRRRGLHELARVVGYVPQNPNSVLFADTLREEIAFTLRNHNLLGDGADILARFGLADFAARYPRDLSGGERQRAALAAMLAAAPPIVLLDEPTRGMDYLQKRRLADLLRGWAASGVTIVVATHDVEWIAGLATRATVLEQGRIINDGPIGEVLLTTPGYNTQLGALFGHPDYLTPEALGQRPPELQTGGHAVS